MTTGLEKKKYWVVVGTRPEVIKQAPVYFELVDRFGVENVALIGTGQHKELLNQALSHFDLKLDLNLEIMQPNQTLAASSSAVLQKMNELFQTSRPEWLVVQGDTTSAAMAAWAAFLSEVKVAHNEAGLRSYDLVNPFPEEANRRLISVIADVHFAPTRLAQEALLREGVSRDKIVVTGNTGIDSLHWTLLQTCPTRVSGWLERFKASGQKPVLVTAHRRENKRKMDQWFSALARFTTENREFSLVFPFHPNHTALAYAEKYLGDSDRAMIMPAIGYDETCHLLNACAFVVTDSGGIQEEAASLGIPVVVCRETTERMEAVEAGLAKLAGTDPDPVIQAMDWAAMMSRLSPGRSTNSIFGDGHAAMRVVNALDRRIMVRESGLAQETLKAA